MDSIAYIEEDTNPALTPESPEDHPRKRPAFPEEACAINPNIPLDHKMA